MLEIPEKSFKIFGLHKIFFKKKIFCRPPAPIFEKNVRYRKPRTYSFKPYAVWLPIVHGRLCQIFSQNLNRQKLGAFVGCYVLNGLTNLI